MSKLPTGYIQPTFDFTIKSLLEKEEIGQTVEEFIKEKKTAKKIKYKISTEEECEHLVSEAIDGYYTLMELLEYDIDLVAKIINYECKKDKNLDRSSCKSSRIKNDCEHLRVGKYYAQIMVLCDNPVSYLNGIVIKLKGKK